LGFLEGGGISWRKGGGESGKEEKTKIIGKIGPFRRTSQIKEQFGAEKAPEHKGNTMAVEYRPCRGGEDRRVLGGMRKKKKKIIIS